MFKAKAAGGVNEYIVSESTDFTLDWQTDKVVTYKEISSGYWGGAHGQDESWLVAFRKDNGKRVRNVLNSNAETPAFKRLIAEGLKEYVQGWTDDANPVSDSELIENLMIESIDEIPLPGIEPVIEYNSLVLQYTHYEIASYAFGAPEVRIPIEKAKPFLTNEVKQLYGIK